MKKLLTGFVMILLSAVAVAERPHGSRGHFFGQLELTEEQREQIKEIRKNDGGRDEIRAVLSDEQRAKLDALRDAKRERRGKRLDRMAENLDLSDEQSKEIRDVIASGGSREDVRNVLTEEQKQKAKELRKERAGKGKHRNKNKSDE